VTDADLLRAVIEFPDADAPRLAYADHLEETAGTVACRWCSGGAITVIPPCPKCRGTGRVSDGRRERAALIRVQCELGRIPDPPPEPSAGMRAAARGQRLAALGAWRRQWSSAYYRLRARERELWADFGKPYERARLFGLPPNWLAFLPAETGQVTSGYAPSDGDAVVRRGFVDELTLTAARWLAHADSLVWSPGQSDPCPGCGGRGDTSRKYATPGRKRCPDCDGTGRVPRPCPATAQPVTRVTLTTAPGLEAHHPSDGYGYWRLPGRSVWVGMDEANGSPRAAAEYLLAAEWPGITFALPPR
jgi:uncharacterized protein (TIGR02996 family)